MNQSESNFGYTYKSSKKLFEKNILLKFSEYVNIIHGDLASTLESNFKVISTIILHKIRKITQNW